MAGSKKSNRREEILQALAEMLESTDRFAIVCLDSSNYIG